MRLLHQFSSTTLIIVGLLLGLVIGYSNAPLWPIIEQVALSFTMLLQMTALPYISLSLITSIGSLPKEQAGKIIKTSLLVIIALSTIVLFFILLSPIAFPDWQNASFYSASTIKAKESTSILSLFIQPNPFNAFANTAIPAIVLFSILLGFGLMQLTSNRSTLTVFTNLQKAIANMNRTIMKIAPIGIFCISYRAAATISNEQIEGLTVYIFSAMMICLFITFCVIPAILALITPLGYRKILKASRTALITAFATGSFFAVIPTLVEKTKALQKEVLSSSKQDDKLTEMLIPITFSLPVGGKLLALLYVLFAGWFSGAHTSINEYINLLVYGIPYLFGNTTLAVSVMLELFNVSPSMHDMFILSENLIGSRLAALVSVIFALAIPTLVITINKKQLTFKSKHFYRNIVVLPLFTILGMYLLKFGFENMSRQYQGYQKFIDRDFIYQTPISHYVDKAQNITTANHSDALTRINHRGLLRVGYFRDDLPYAFHNQQGKLVGFDIEILNLLALDLNVDIEFVRIFHDQAAHLLASGYLDITTGVPLIPDNLTTFTLTAPYSEQMIAFLVKDERRAEFTQWKNIKNRADLVIGIPETFFYQRAVEQHFTENKAWEISTPRLYFKEEYQHIDALLFGAAAASGWTLLYPEYTVVSPRPVLEPIFMAFPINKDDHAFEKFMANWIEMKKQNRSIEKLFNYWIEGKKQ